MATHRTIKKLHTFVMFVKRYFIDKRNFEKKKNKAHQITT